MSYRMQNAPRNGPTFDLRYDPNELKRAQQYVGKDGTLSFRIVNGPMLGGPPAYEVWMHDEVTPGGLQLSGATGAATQTARLSIPVPQVAAERSQDAGPIALRLRVTESMADLMQYNPKFYLMRYKKSSSRRSLPVAQRKRIGNKRWVHPTHNNGAGATAGGNFDGGSHTRIDGSLIAARPSEWAVASAEPFVDTLISFDPTVWFSSAKFTTPPYLPVPPFSGPPTFHQVAGTDGGNIPPAQYYASQSFAFCIGMDNPDPATAGRVGHIRGPLSKAFTVDWSNTTGFMRLTLTERIQSARKVV